MSSPSSSTSNTGRGRPNGNSGGRRTAGQNRSGAQRSGNVRGTGSATIYSSGSYPAGASADSIFATGAFAASIPADGATSRDGNASGGSGRARQGDRRPVRGDAPRSDSRRSDAPRGSSPTRADRPRGGEAGRPTTEQSRNPRGRGGRRTAAADDRSPVVFAAHAPRTYDRPSTDDGTAAGSVSLFAATKTVTADAAPMSDTTFLELGVPEKLIKPLAALGAISPFPIQAATLPVSLTGRDVLGRGRTGSGKTIAFAVPLVARLTGGRRTPHRPRGLVLLPTRELALQVARTIEPLATAAGLKMVTIFGGVGFGPQTTALRSGVDIVVACPGRLEDLIKQGQCNLGDVEVTVLDEADHMADLGFLPGVRRLLRATRPNGQRLLFSATLDNGISVLVKDFLHDPAVHAVDDASSHVETMTHHVFAVSKDDRNEVIRQLAIGGGRRMLFTRTKFGAKKWAAALSKNGIPAVDLHGNLSQNARERNLAAFSTGSAKVLVATDIAARGIHVDDVELVVHLDPPTEHKAYLHRSGRTARAGAGGTVITVMLPEQADDVRKLMKLAGISATTTAVRPGHSAIGELAG